MGCAVTGVRSHWLATNDQRHLPAVKDSPAQELTNGEELLDAFLRRIKGLAKEPLKSFSTIGSQASYVL
jgi:hypothetical protein